MISDESSEAAPDDDPPSSPRFQARNLTKTYRLGETRVEALRGVDLSVSGGELAVIVGPSGSGKSTLLHLLGLLDTPDDGTVLLDGREVSDAAEAERTRIRRRELGFVFQSFNLVPVLTALENVAYPLWLDGVGRAERRRRATEMLEAVGLAERLDHRPDRLSGGERQRVAIARALVHRPAAVLADEPTGNLDSTTGGAVIDLLERLNREQGVTVLLATHDPHLIERAPRRVTIQDGRVTDDSGSHDGGFDDGETAP